MDKRIIVEENAIDVIPTVIKEFKKVLIVTTQDLHLLFNEWMDNLFKLPNVEKYYLNDYSVQEALKISSNLIINYFDCIVSIGGGTVNDTCKLAAKYGDKIFVSIPTIVSNDGVCSNTAVLKFDGTRTDGLPAKSPDIIIVDTKIVKSAPKKFLEAGICDIISNYTALYDWQLAIEHGCEKQNDIAKIIASNALYNILNLSEPINPNSNWHIKLVCESLILSGIAMEIKGNTRPCSGSEHLFNHAINAYHSDLKILHGYLVGLGALATSIFQEQDYDMLLNYLKKNKIDIRPSCLGITKEVFVDAWLKASSTRPNRYTVLNKKNITKQDIIKIYNKIEKEKF